MPRKITRIFFRLSGAVFMCLLFLVLTLFFAIQTSSFQTWLGHRAAAYFSSEWQTTVFIRKIDLKFFSKAHLHGVLVLDQSSDTLLAGDILADFSKFDLRRQAVTVSSLMLQNCKSKLIKPKGEKNWNYDFIISYFGSAGSSDSTAAWDIKIKSATLNDVSFVYRDENRMGVPPGTIDFDDIWLQHVNGQISDIVTSDDRLKIKVERLSAFEKSGFQLQQLHTIARISATELLCENLRIQTEGSFVKGTVRFRHSSWDDYPDFTDKVYMSSLLEDSTSVTGKDLAYFTSELSGLDATVKVSGKVKGFVNDMHISGMSLNYGNDTRFRGDLSVSGLTNPSTAYLHLDASELSTSYNDLRSLPLYPFNEQKTIDLPIELSRLGVMSYKGKIDGFMNDITTYGTFSSKLGSAWTQLNLITGLKSSDVSYVGRIKTTEFDIGKLFALRTLGKLSIDARVKGSGIEMQKLNAELEGFVAGLEFNRYRYKNISINGKFREKLFTGMVVSADSNANFDFNGTINFQKQVPQIDFISTINRLNLYQLNLSHRADSGYLSSQLLIDIHGDNIDNLSGLINLDNTIYQTPHKTYRLSTFNILMRQQTEEKKIRIQSAYVNAMIEGRYELSNLPNAFRTTLNHYYPTFFEKPAGGRQYQDQFSFRMRVKNFNSIVELFVPELRVSANSRAEGDFDAASNKLNLQLASPEISYGNLRLNELLVILNETDNKVLAEISGKSLRVTDSLGFSNFEFAVRSTDKKSDFNIDWDNLRSPLSNKGSVEGELLFGTDQFLLSNHKFEATINDSTWLLEKPYQVIFEKNGAIAVDRMELKCNNQRLSVEGRLARQSADSLVIEADNVIFEQFNPLLQLWNLNVKGNLNGHMALSRVNSNLVFNGRMDIQQFVLNKNAIGEMQVFTRYNAGDQQISLNGFTSLGLVDEFGRQAKNISFNGIYHLDRKSESLDLDFAARPANLSVLNPFLEDIITINKGFVNGEGKIHGTPSEIKIDGAFKLFNSEVKVDYTNVTYNITGLIEVMPDQIRFSDLLVREKGTRTAPQGTVNGNLFHRNFSDLQIDYDISYRNMLVMNTTEKDNSTFYGRIYGSGNVGIYGFINDLHMVIVDTTKKNSQFFLPLDGPAEIGESDFIHFVKRDTVKVRQSKTLSGFDLDMRIHATPDAQVQIILDKQHGDMLNAQGQGDLQLRLNTLGKFEMFGDYILTNGFYLFTLENVINKRFDIEPGSSISWSGNPYNAEISITTKYRQRTSIATLLNDQTGAYSGRVPAECNLLISGRLQSPQIKLGLDFPTVDANARARIASVLSDEAELNRQVFSFLLFRSFVSPLIFNNQGGGVTAQGAAVSTGSEMLSNRVSDFLNTYFGNLTGINDLQLGLNYRPGSQANSDAVDLALSKQFLNNKITVDGNFGVNNQSTQNRNTGGLIGDVNIDYKLSEDGRYRLKGFNRSNDNAQITIAGGPYTQGIGFFYREEFETFQQLFKRYLKKVNRNRDLK